MSSETVEGIIMNATVTAGSGSAGNHWLIEVFDTLGGDPSLAIGAAQNYSSIGFWVASQAAQAATTGAIAVAIPFAHLPALAVDVAFLLHKMCFCSWGIGALHGCTVDGKEDFAIILRLWAGDLQETELPVVLSTAAVSGLLAVGIAQYGVAGLVGKAAAEAAKAATIAAGQKIGAKGAAKAAGKLTGKIGEKAASKIAAKFVSKFKTKSIAGFLPLIGPVLGGGINAYFVKDIADSAGVYYAAKKAQLG